MKEDEIKKEIKTGYGRIAKRGGSCCGGTNRREADAASKGISRDIGYSEEELKSVPEGANLGLGCGNPTALASLKQGETVLDLGSGAGLDCFLAAKRVGGEGRVIGVDMTPEMITRATTSAKKEGYTNVEFRLGEIEHLPVKDGSVDVVISNCVINLSPDKPKVFQEMFRVLKRGGRMMVSDIVLTKPLPCAVRESVAAHLGCLAGAMLKEDYVAAVEAAGFQVTRPIGETSLPVEYALNDPMVQELIKDLRLPAESVAAMADCGVSLKIHAVKP